MILKDRVFRYVAIEEYRKRPLIVYATSTRVGIRAAMAHDAVREFIDQVDAVPDGEKVDVLLHSMGGDALAAWKIMSVLRERFKNVSVLVPYAAFSAATVFALGANEIVMHPNASLGPIDPQIAVNLPNGTMRQFAYEDLVEFLGFLRNDVILTEQQHVSTVMDKLFSAVDPLVVGAAKRASDLSTEVGERLLSMHLDDDRKAKQIAQNLNKSFFSHGDAVSRTRAKKLDLQVAEPDVQLEKLLWDAYLGIEEYLEMRRPFNALALFMSDTAAAASLAPRAPVSLPSNASPQLVQQVWTAVANQAVQSAAGMGNEVPYSIVNALVESRRRASENRTTGKISAVRQPAGEIRLAIHEVESRWQTCEPG